MSMSDEKITYQLEKKQYRNRAGVLGGFAGKSPHNGGGYFPKALQRHP